MQPVTIPASTTRHVGQGYNTEELIESTTKFIADVEAEKDSRTASEFTAGLANLLREQVQVISVSALQLGMGGDQDAELLELVAIHAEATARMCVLVSTKLRAVADELPLSEPDTESAAEQEVAE